ncbi:MAG: hypothetical protein J6T03_03505 [Bacteroidales bacterium]|nr:hypothetical protein [Bacteroidales bacterium]
MENIKEMMKKIEGEDKKEEKTGACGYNWAIGICLTVYLGLMVFLWLGSMRVQYVWDVIVQTTLVMVIVSVVMYYVLKALFAARKEKLEAYRRMEAKRVAVYEKLMDMQVDALKEEKKREEEKINLNQEKAVFAERKGLENAKAEHEAELAKKRATIESEIDKIRNA